jgi:pyridoxine 5'-phosphate synthase PdxJ
MCLKLAGQSRLSELPGSLTRLALFIDKHSDPKHMAADLSVPTVEIHSRAADPYESWAKRG